MMFYAFAATLLTFLVVDALWIGVVARKIYTSELGDWMRSSPGFVAAGLFYVIFTAGIFYLAVYPAIGASSPGLALLNGAVIGGLAYGTFTVTNYAILQRWTLKLVISDILWGVTISAISALAGYLVAGGA